jgi:hypothetical protein
MSSHRRPAVGAIAFTLFCAAAPIPARAEVIDISALVGKPFDQTFFAAQGLIFTSQMSLGFVQGDDALIAPVSGRLVRPIDALSVLVAPGSQGTADYTLALFDVDTNLTGSTTIRVTQDFGDPENTGFGYVPLTVGRTSTAAHFFSLSNRFVRSSFSEVGNVEFAVSTLEFSPVPEPGSWLLLLSGGVALWRRKRNVL